VLLAQGSYRLTDYYEFAFINSALSQNEHVADDGGAAKGRMRPESTNRMKMMQAKIGSRIFIMGGLGAGEAREGKRNEISSLFVFMVS
jgi:hypothetical protein